MKLLNKCFLIVITAIFSGCNNDDAVAIDPLDFTYDFENDSEGWTGDFADYPEGEEEFYELQFEHSMLPEPLNTSSGAIKLSGNNHSDDLFMFIKKEVSGLNPNQEYNITFSVEFASNVADDMVGIGGSPGESVYIKAGATPIEPNTILDDEGFLRLNIDKGNQSESGEDMIVIGDFSNDTEENQYHLKTVTNTNPFRAMTNSSGTLWLIVGTDSGFEGTTTIYFNEIQVEVN